MKLLTPLSIVVLISGNGSNLQAIINATQKGLEKTLPLFSKKDDKEPASQGKHNIAIASLSSSTQIDFAEVENQSAKNNRGLQPKPLKVEICAVISNRKDAYGLKRAQQQNIPAYVISHENFASRKDFEDVLKKTIDHYRPDLVVLAGFMRKLGKAFVTHYKGRIINIHPSLLPKYPGLHTHERVLAAAEQEHGVSIHYVTEDLDAGPIICQARLLVNSTDTKETLSQRIQAVEHVLYPQVLSWFADKRLILRNNQVFLDNEALPPTGKQFILFS